MCGAVVVPELKMSSVKQELAALYKKFLLVRGWKYTNLKLSKNLTLKNSIPVVYLFLKAKYIWFYMNNPLLQDVYKYALNCNINM